MTFDGAVVRERGVTFAIAVVNANVLQLPSERDALQMRMSLLFRVPTVLMAQDSWGRPTYWGRRDIVNFLSGVDPSRIPWRRYTLS
ncbi:MAG: hypothetical protein JOZ77_07895 [Candidatus Eremiobacteraeota bacterium]|nr:hypothetical protein [Candidatus Eremiobacteraeota bacterium]